MTAMPPADLPLDALPWLLGLWFAALGGAVGSFLNVVVYRLPAGKSLVHPPSHCPKCGHAIRWHDNVPVLGWLLLNGRCRDCRAPISARYPLVEAVTALMFLAVGLAEQAGSVADAGLALATAGYGFVLLSTLLAAALIEYDGHPLPVSLALPAWVVGLLLPLAWPGVRAWHVVAGLSGPLAGLADGAAGVAAGLVLAGLGWWLVGPKRRPGLLVAASLVGLFLGWQAAVVLVPAAVVLCLLLSTLAHRWPAAGRLSPAAWLWAGTLAWVLTW